MTQAKVTQTFDGNARHDADNGKNEKCEKVERNQNGNSGEHIAPHEPNLIDGRV